MVVFICLTRKFSKLKHGMGQVNFSLEYDMIPKALNKNRKLKGFICAEKFIDIGIPEDYQAAATFFEN